MDGCGVSFTVGGGDHSECEVVGVFVGVMFRMGDIGMWMFQSGWSVKWLL